MYSAVIMGEALAFALGVRGMLELACALCHGLVVRAVERWVESDIVVDDCASVVQPALRGVALFEVRVRGRCAGCCERCEREGNNELHRCERGRQDRGHKVTTVRSGKLLARLGP